MATGSRTGAVQTVVAADGVTVVEVHGDLDAQTAATLVEALEQPRRQGDSIVVDLSGLTAGAAAVEHAVRYAYERTRRTPGRTLVVQAALVARFEPALAGVPHAGSRDEAVALAREASVRVPAA